MTNFATNLEEATLKVTPDKLRIKSYYEEEKGEICQTKWLLAITVIIGRDD